MSDDTEGLFDVRPNEVGEQRYAVFGLIGAGAVAEVFHGEDRQTGAEVAVKIMRVPMGARSQIGTRFLAEAKVLAAIPHPHLPRVHKAGREGNFYWFVMDLAEGGSVAQRVHAEGTIPTMQALRIAFEITSALHAVHAKGLIHRDVKPENVLLDAAGHALLADFGIARHPEGTVPVKTLPGQLMGTRGYRAPEQEDDAHTVGPESDLYGVTATLYHMLTGKKPRRLWEDPEGLDALEPHAAALIRRGASAVPVDRYPTAEAMARAIARTADAVAGSTSLEPEWMGELYRASGTPEKTGFLGWVRGWFSRPRKP
ncbi:MAG: serine/threonine-protein kinase [Myxococcota bacterium]